MNCLPSPPTVKTVCRVFTWSQSFIRAIDRSSVYEMKYQQMTIVFNVATKHDSTPYSVQTNKEWMQYSSLGIKHDICYQIWLVYEDITTI